MSNRPTPETDASQHEGLLRGNAMPTQVVHVNFARKLERERDEAREQIEVCRGIIERTVIARNSALSDLAELERERDEAREAIRALAEHGESEIQRITKERDEARGALASREVVIAQQNVITDLMLERDEARAVASELSDIASKHLSFLLAITPTKPNEKHEKETEKVIDALNRWKKL